MYKPQIAIESFVQIGDRIFNIDRIDKFGSESHYAIIQANFIPNNNCVGWIPCMLLDELVDSGLAIVGSSLAAF